MARCLGVLALLTGCRAWTPASCPATPRTVDEVSTGSAEDLCADSCPRVVTGDVILLDPPPTLDLSCVTAIGGDLVVGGAESTWTAASRTCTDHLPSLEALSGVTSVGGDATIECLDLASLAGLESLARIDGSLTVTSVSGLRSLEGLTNLQSVGGQLSLYDLGDLTSLRGLDRLHTVGALSVQLCPRLSSVAGLESLEEVTGTVILQSLDALQDLEGLSGLETVLGGLRIEYNDQLSSLGGLRSLRELGAELRIVAGESLRRLDGPPALQVVGADAVFYASDAGFDAIDGLGLVEIGGYLVLFNTRQLASPGTLASLETVGRELEISGNQALTDLTGFSALRSAGGLLAERLDALVSLDGLVLPEHLDGGVLLTDNPRLTSLEALSGVRTLAYLHVRGNPSLETLQGLRGVAVVDGNVAIGPDGYDGPLANDALTSLSGLEALSSVGGSLTIAANPGLTSVAELISLDYVGGSLVISDNPSLGDGAAWSLAGTIHTVDGDVVVSDNQ